LSETVFIDGAPALRLTVDASPERHLPNGIAAVGDTEEDLAAILSASMEPW